MVAVSRSGGLRPGPWWLWLVSGGVWLLFAAVVLTVDVTTVYAVALAFGLFLLFQAVVQIVLAATSETWSWLHGLAGGIAMAAGVLALTWPGQTFQVLAALVGWFLAARGTYDLVVALAHRHQDRYWWGHLLFGLAQLTIGVWAIGYTGRSVALLVLWVAIVAIVRGFDDIATAFGIRDQGPLA